MVSTKLVLKLSFSYFLLVEFNCMFLLPLSFYFYFFKENVQSSFLPPKMSIANLVVNSTTMLQENHLTKRNIRKVKDTTTSQASQAISMVHGK